jgi:hypothetical protein
MATAPRAILTNHGWRNYSIGWQITLGREEHEQIPGALVLDDQTQTACLAGRLAESSAQMAVGGWMPVETDQTRLPSDNNVD